MISLRRVTTIKKTKLNEMSEAKDEDYKSQFGHKKKTHL